MRNIHFKSLVFSLALTAGLACVEQAQAQEISFRRATNAEADAIGIAMSDCVPVVADFNNDGFMDLFTGGQTWEERHTTGSQGQDTLAWTWWDDTRFCVNNGDGTWTVAANRDDGLPYMYRGMSNKAFDFNQDGYVDFILPSVNVGWTFQSPNALILMVNNGDGTFTRKEDAALASINPSISNSLWNEGQAYFITSIADYDKDGYPDLLIQYTSGSPYRNVALFKNVEGDHFERVENPLFYSKDDTEAHPFIPQSNGMVTFGDFNADGWPDILTYGWGDGNNDLDLKGGGQTHLYRNLKNGSFELATTDFNEDIDSLSNYLNGSYGDEHAFFAIDYDQDGKQDLLVFGGANYEGENNNIYAVNGKHALMFRNVSEGEKIKFEIEETQLYPLSGSPARMAHLADFNGDGWVDFICRGWNGSWMDAISSSAGEYNAFYVAEGPNNTGSPLDSVNRKEGYMAFGDLNNDGMLDLFTQDNCDRLSWSINTTDPEDENGLQIPGAPESLKAEYKADTKQIVVTWDACYTPDSESKAVYNLYLKNKATGKTFMIAPANPETGKQLTYTAWSGYVPCETYTFEGVEAGNYTIGVQAVTYSWLASGFATTDLTLNENPTAAFGVTAIDPSGMKDVESLSTIILTFNQDVFPNAQENAKAITLTDGEGQALDITVKKVPAQPQIQITLPPTIEAGEYTLNVPEGAVCRDNGDWNRAFRRTINATGLTAYTPVSISGDEGNYGSLQTFTLTFPEGTNAVVDTTGTDERPYMIHNDSTKQTKGKLAQGEETNQILLTLDENIAVEGSYTLVIPAGLIQRADITETPVGEDSVKMDTTMILASAELRYDYTIGMDLVPDSITPEEGKMLALKDFTIYFPSGRVPTVNAEAGTEAYLLNKADNSQVKATLAVSTASSTRIDVALEEEVTAEGEYTLIIPARMIQETSIQQGEDGGEPVITAEYAPNLKYDYTISYDYVPVSTTPAEGEVTALKDIILTFGEGTYATLGEANGKAVLAYAEDGSETEVTLAAGENANEIKATLAAEVTAFGEYTLTIPAQAILQVDGEEGQTVVDYSPALKYTFTLTDGEGIGEVLADAETADVYTVSGILVKKDAKADDLKGLKKGIYIVNGKKVAIK